MWRARGRLALGMALGMALAAGTALLLARWLGRSGEPGDAPEPPAVALEIEDPAERAAVRALAADWPSLRADTEDLTLPPGALLRLGSSSLRHGSSVHALAFSPDGRQLVSASDDGITSAWDTTSGQALWKYHGKRCTTLRYADTGRRLFCATTTGPVVALDPANGHALLRLPGGGRSPSYAGYRQPFALSPDGAHVALRGEDGRVHLLSARDGATLWHGPPVLGEHAFVAFTPAGALLAGPGEGRGDDCVDRIEFAAEPTLSPYRLAHLEEAAFELAASSDATRLAASTSRATAVWDAETGQRLWSGSGGAARLALSRDGGFLAAALPYAGITVFDTVSGTTLLRRDDAHTQTLAVAVSADGELAASGGYGGDVRLWDLREGAERLGSGHPRGAVRAFAFVPGAPTILTGGDDGRLALWDAASGALVRGIDAGTHVERMLLRADGRVIVAGAHAIRVMDLEHPEPPVLELGMGAWGGCAFAIDAAGRRAARGCRSVEVWDLDTGQSIFATARLEEVQPWAGLAFVRSGSRLLGCRRLTWNTHALVLWDLERGREIWSQPLAEPCRELHAAADGQHVLINAASPAWWRIRDNGPVAVTRIAIPGSAFAVSGAETRLAVVRRDSHAIEVVELLAPGSRWREPRILARFNGVPGLRVTALAFTPDGRTLLSALGDSTVLAWSLDGAPTTAGPGSAERAVEAEEGSARVAHLSFDGHLEGHGVVATAADAARMSFVPGREGDALQCRGELEVEGREEVHLERSFTLQFWFRLREVPPIEPISVLLLLRSPLLTIDVRGGRLFVFRHFEGGGHMQLHLEQELTPLEPDRWHHLAIVQDRQAGELRAYLGGLLLRGDPARHDNLESRLWPLTLGTRGNGSPAMPAFSGAFDELQIFDHARSPEQIRTDAQGGQHSVRSLERP